MPFDLVLPAGCPTADVEAFEGVAFRLVRTDPPTDADLLTYLELNLARTADACKRGSVSLFATREQAQHLLEMRPYVGKFVASITLTPAHGRVGRPSGSGHMDWWPYQGMRRVADLTVVER